MIDDVLRELQASGRVDSEGQFTLDRAKAREKLRRYQLADPRAYVLELVQAASLKGATRVRFDIDSRDMTMEFDGRPFTVEDFDDVYGAALRHDPDPDVRARRQLALGLGSAMALRLTQIVVESGNGTTGARLRLQSDGDDAFEAVETSRVGTRIHVRERFGLGTFVAFVRNIQGALAEERHLRERCGYASLMIDLEGRHLARGLHLREPVLDEVRIEHGHSRLVCGLLEAGESSPIVHVVKDGVWITSHELPDVRFPGGFVAVVEDDALRKEVSQTDVVRDYAYHAMTKVLWRGATACLVALARRFEATGEPAWALDPLLSLMEHLTELDVRWDVDEPSGRVQALRCLRLWQTIDRRRLSLGELLAEVRATGEVATTGRMRLGDAPLSGRSFVVYIGGSDTTAAVLRTILRRILGERLVDVTAILQRRATWRARPTAPVLPEGVYLARRRFEAPGVRGEVGIEPNTMGFLSLEPAVHSVVTLVVEGCVLAQRRPVLPWLGLRMIVGAECFVPDPSCRFLRRSPESTLALLHAVAVIPEVYAQLASAPASSFGDECAMSFCRALLRRDSLLVLWPSARDDPPPGLREAVAAFGPEHLQLDPGLDTDTPHPVLGMRLWPTLGPRRYSLLELRQLDARGQSLRFVAEPIPDIEADVLVLGDEDRALVQAWLSQPMVDASSAMQALREQTQFMLESPATLALDPSPTAVVVPIEGEGISGRLRVGPLRGVAPRPQPITVLHRSRPIDVITLLLVGSCDGWVESTALPPTPGFDGVEDGEALDDVRRAVLRAFASASLRIAERFTTERGTHDAGFLREVMTLMFPIQGLRTIHDTITTGTGGTGGTRPMSPAQAAEIHRRFYAAMHAAADAGALFELERRLQALQKMQAPAAAAATELPPPSRSQDWALAAVDVLFPPGDEPHDLAGRSMRPIALLGALPLLRRPNGDAVTMDQLRAGIEREQTILYVDRPSSVEVGARPVVLATVAERDALRRIAGRHRVERGDVVLANERQEELELSHVSELEVIELAPAQTLVSMRVSAGMVGEVGLVRSHPANPEHRPQLRLQLCWKRRPIEAVELDGAPGELVAVINDDRLTTDPVQGRAQRTGAFVEVVAQCHRCAPPLVAALLQRWPELTTTEQTDAWYHMLDAFVAREATRDPSHPVAQVRGFSGVEGVPLSLAELVEAYATHDCVYVLPAPWSRWGPSLLPPDRAVVCADPYELSVLRSLFPNVKEVQASWKKWREQERARERSVTPRASKAIEEPCPTPRSEPELEPGPEPGIEPPPALRQPTPEERLVEALRAELSRVRERNDTLLCDEHLERIRVVPLPRKRRALVAWADADGVTVNRVHPVVERALAGSDPVWHAYLCSAIYTAINVWLEEITDADEQRFLGCFAELAASG